MVIAPKIERPRKTGRPANPRKESQHGDAHTNFRDYNRQGHGSFIPRFPWKTEAPEQNGSHRSKHHAD